MTETKEPSILFATRQTLAQWFDASPLHMEKAARMYAAAWGPQLCDDEHLALEKMLHFDATQAWVATDPDGEPRGLLHSVGVYVPTLSALYGMVPTYGMVESLAGSGGSGTGRVSVRVCFSLAVPDKVRIASFDGSKPMSIAQFLLDVRKQEPSVRTLAYSKVNHVPQDMSLVDAVQQGFRNTQFLGAVGLHEHLGGITVAVLNGSRMEDHVGGQGNVLVAYPKTHDESALFETIKAQRKTRTAPAAQMVLQGEHGRSMVVFEDIASRMIL